MPPYRGFEQYSGDLGESVPVARGDRGSKEPVERASGQDADEADDVRSHGLVREVILRQQPDDLAALANQDVGVGGKSACQFGVQLRSGHSPPEHEGAGRADVDGIEVRRLFGERGWPEDPATADVDSSQQNHECHAFLLPTPLETAIAFSPSRPGIRTKRGSIRSL
jgi:hypothetical protein